MNYENFRNRRRIVMTMTFKEFVEKAISSDIYVDPNYGIEYERGSSRYNRNRKVTKPGRWAVSVKWSTGGISGGSCWDNERSNHYSTSGEEEPEFDDFENLLLAFVPDITFRDYKELRNKTVKNKQWTEYEYYGNSSNYAEKYAYLEDIYNFLKEKNYV